MNLKKNLIVSSLSVCLTLFIITGFAIAGQIDWPVFQGNSARTGYADSGIPREPKLLWQLNVKDFKEKGIDPREINRPIVYNKKVFISSPESEVIGLDLNTGGFLWHHKEQGFYQSSIAAGDGKIFTVFNDSATVKNTKLGFIGALDEQNGRLLWKYHTQEPISYSSPLFESNKVFVGDSAGNLYAINSRTGELIWKKFLDAEVIHSSPAFYKGMIFVGTEGSGMSNVLPSRLFALDAETGNTVWKFQIDFIPGKANLVHGTPAILNDIVYFGSENGYFYALAYDNGKLIWKKKIASGGEFLAGVSAPPVLSAGKIFVTTWEGSLFSLEQKTGEIAWQKVFDKSGKRGDAAAIAGSGMVCITVDEKFSCLDENDGKIIWQKEFFGGIPAVASGILIVSDMEIADGSPANAPVLLAFSDTKNTGLPRAMQAGYDKKEQKTDLLFVAIIIVGICFLTCLGFLIYKVIKNHMMKI